MKRPQRSALGLMLGNVPLLAGAGAGSVGAVAVAGVPEVSDALSSGDHDSHSPWRRSVSGCAADVAISGKAVFAAAAFGTSSTCEPAMRVARPPASRKATPCAMI